MNPLQNNPSPRRQTGAALLAIMLVLIVAASYMLVSKLNTNVRQYTRQGETLNVLRDAKAALLSYSVTYPDDPAHTSGGPGVLPCPYMETSTYEGQALPSCSFSGNKTLGRFPWKTVGVGVFKDHHGEELWYVVSDNFRTPVTGPINSDTPGTLNVNSSDDIVAIIFAPGEPVEEQDRGDGPWDPANYLEGGNEVNDNNFIQRTVSREPGSEFNDQLVFITKRELMNLVEKRVLGDVEKMLNVYRDDPDFDDDASGIDSDCSAPGPQDCDNAFPWLAPFSNPSDSSFKSVINTYSGHVPFHYSGDPPDASNNRNPYHSTVSLSWKDITGADTNRSGTITTNCLNNIDCDDGIFNSITELDSSTEIECVWSERESVDCDTVTTTRTTAYQLSPWCSNTGTLVRTYTIKFPEFSGEFSATPPRSTDIRRRSVVLDSTADPLLNLPEKAEVMELIDRYTGERFSWFYFSCILVSDYTTGLGNSDFLEDTNGKIETKNIKYDIDIDSGELPEWFVLNKWHELVYVAYPDTESLPGSNTTVCDPASDECLTIEGIPGTHNNKRAVSLIAGNDLTGNRPSSLLSDYFEDENATQDNIFIKAPAASDFNDKIRIVLEVP